MDKERNVQVMKTASWLYDESAKMTVKIIKQNWDYYYEEGQTDSLPNLNEQGEAYYVILDNSAKANPHRSRTCLSLSKAIQFAEEILQNRITWDN